MSSSVWAKLMKPASYCEGARYTPRSSIARCLVWVGVGVGAGVRVGVGVRVRFRVRVRARVMDYGLGLWVRV